MIQRFLLASTLILSSTIAFASTAKADTGDVHFTATVPSACTFSSVTAGTLGLVGTSTLTSAAGGGTAGSASLTCNNALATLTVDAPAVTSAPTGYSNSDATKTVSVVGSGANVISLSAAGTNVATPILGTTTLAVNMSTTTTAPLPNGDYDLYVRLTVTP
jgi:hypothetical protein